MMMEKFSKQREHQVSSIEILIATEAKEGLLVWTDSFGLAIKGGQVGEATIALIHMGQFLQDGENAHFVSYFFKK